MNPHQDFIDARRGYIARAVEEALEKGHDEEQLIVVLVDAQTQRDTWPSRGPDDDDDVAPASTHGIGCVAMPIVVARTLLDLVLREVSRPPQPGFVRVFAVYDGTAFFTHASITREL